MSAMPTNSPNETAPGGAADDYELMRSHALGGDTDAHRELGLVLFLRSGMVAWLCARARWQRSTPRSRQREAERGGPLPGGLRDELTKLWAAMAFSSIQQEVHA